MKRQILTVLFLLFTVLLSAQEYPNVGTFSTVSKLKQAYVDGTSGMKVGVMKNDYFNIKGGEYLICYGCTYIDDSINWVRDIWATNYFGSDVGWQRVGDYSELADPVGNANKIAVVNGTGTGYSLVNASALVTSIGLTNPSGNNAQVSANFLSGSPVSSSTLSIPTGFGWADPVSLSTSDRALNTAYQISTTKYAVITVSAKLSCNLSLSGGQTGAVTLQKSANGTTGWAPSIPIESSNTGTLTIGLNTTQVSGAPMTTILKPGEYWRLVPSGNCTSSFNGGEQRVSN